ncbi:hypothetical protein [Pseudalkalibacillus decolorationis]|uniref:hypothetical protein n=1 Tax=Pseudalkalibacillus decolorationis TaxID=163879 RepID=UPI002147531C|nr:hypothetical protein [Pseudalkalibacillus decolorationis]
MNRFKILLSLLFKIVPLRIVGNKIIDSLLSILMSSVFVYLAGYLFLWGYYFGGIEDRSLLTVAVNFIPINRGSSIAIGLFYLLSILIAGLFVLSIFKEKISVLTVFSMFISLIFAHIGTVLFFFGEVTFSLFVKMLTIWVFPVTIVIVIGMFYVGGKYPVKATLSMLYLIILYMNLVILNEKLQSGVLSQFLIPELFTLLIFIAIPLLIVTFKKVKKGIYLFIIKFIVYLTSIVPLSILIPLAFFRNKYIVVIGSALIITILSIILIEKIVKYESKRKIFTNTKGQNNIKPLSKNPYVSFLFLFTIGFAALSFTPNFLIDGGDYFYQMINADNYQEITYIWDKKKVTVEGMIVSYSDNTYYISTKEQKLLMINSKDIKMETK